MYLSFYNLKTEPFKISTDPDFLWLGEKHKEALATLRYGILGNKGILLLTGDVGTGKTTLINMLLKNLGEDTIVATVPDPGLDRMDFYNYVANAFDINKTFHSKGEFILYLTHFLKTAYSDKKKVLLIVDEAQRLNKELLEEIRLLSNIELQHTKLINLFFVGQIEFNDIIASEENKALRQRITLRYNIEPLNLKETGEYIKHRLQVAGAKKAIFNAKAIAELYTYTKGYPRLINVICDYALLTGYVKEQKVIGASIIMECANELKIPQKMPKQIVQEEKKEAPIIEKQPNEREIVWQPYALGSGDKDQENILYVAPKKQRNLLFYKLGIIFLVVLLLLSLGYHFLPASSKTKIVQNLLSLPQNTTHANNSVVKEKVPLSSTNASIPDAIGNKHEEAVPEIKPLVTEEKLNEEKKSINEIDQSTADNTTENKKVADIAPVIPVQETKPAPENTSAVTDIKKADTINTPSEKSLTASEPIDASQSEPVYPVQPLGIYENKKTDSAYLASYEKKTSAPAADIKKDTEKALIFFNSNSFTLTTAAIAKLDDIIKEAELHPDSEIIIKGYTDSTGPFVYNERLSIFRAFSVKSYLVDHGISPSKAKAFGMGPRPPYDENGNRIPHRMTRTVEIEIKR